MISTNNQQKKPTHATQIQKRKGRGEYRGGNQGASLQRGRKQGVRNQRGRRDLSSKCANASVLSSYCAHPGVSHHAAQLGHSHTSITHMKIHSGEARHSCPGRQGIPCPWRRSRSMETWHWETWAVGIVGCVGVGPGDLSGLFPP